MMSEDLFPIERFQQMYEDCPPWDIGKPQPVFVEAAERITGSVLDAGCGTGENSLFFAQQGRQVTGIDFLELPIAQAKRKAWERSLEATFLVMDALRLDALADVFDSVVDCGLFHVFSDDDRSCYVANLASVVKPGGKVFMMCFSDKEPPGDGPRRISQEEIHSAFSAGWEVESIAERRFEIRPDLKDYQFSEGGPIAWFCVIAKTE